MAKPKAILFDIGGVCVASPFEAIVEYETKNGIPKDYINFSIARAAPNGAWQRLERGEIKMDNGFFELFRNDLNNPQRWQEYHSEFKNRHDKKTLKQLAGAKATQLGDPISLKAETSNTIPTPDEKGAPRSSSGRKRMSFKDVANRSMLGDPVSLKAEATDHTPLPDDSGAATGRPPAAGAERKPNSLKQSYSKNMLGDPTSLKNEGSQSDPIPDQQDTGYSKESQDSGNSLKNSYKKNMLGDPTSLQNEKVESGTSQTQQAPDRNTSAPTRSSGNSLKDSYSKNMLGDPTSLKNEGSSSDPVPSADQATGYGKGETSSKSSSSSSSSLLHESFKRNPLGDPTSLKNEGSSSEPIPSQQDTGLSKGDSPRTNIPGLPPVPVVDSTTLFWDMMARSRTPDPHMFPALQTLKDSRQYLVGALSNTVVFPPGHEYAKSENWGLHPHFDVFVSSAQVGLRKPDPEIYKLAIERLDRFDKGHGGDGIKPQDVVFLDDIGANLKAAKALGIRTIKVNIGKVDEAVKELEQATGLKLTGSGKSKL